MKRLILSLLCMILGTSVVVAQMEMDEESRTRLLAKSDSLFARGVDLYNASNYTEAIPVFAECDSIDNAILPKENYRRVHSTMWLASCYYQLGDTLKASEAFPYYEYSPVDRRLTVKHDSLCTLGFVAYKKNDYKSALVYLTQCADMEKSIVGENHMIYLDVLWKIAVSYSYLALHNSELGKYSEAIRLETEALNVWEELFGNDDEHYTVSLTDLASYYAGSGNYSEAIRLATKVLNIREKTYGKEYLGCADALKDLASYYAAGSGNYSEAIRLATEALNIEKKALGEEHPNCAQSLSNLASYYADLGNYSEAIRLSTEALNIREKVYGKEHVLSLGISVLTAQVGVVDGRRTILLAKSDSLFALGVDLYNTGKYEKAIPVFTECNEIDKAVSDSTSNRRHYYSTMWLASCYYHLGDSIKADYMSYLDWNYKWCPVDRRLTVKSDSLSEVGHILWDNGDLENALDCFMQCAEIEKAVVGENHVWYRNSLNTIGEINLQLGNYRDAAHFITEALNIDKTDNGLDDSKCSVILAEAYFLRTKGDTLMNKGDHYHAIKNYVECALLERKILNPTKSYIDSLLPPVYDSWDRYDRQYFGRSKFYTGTLLKLEYAYEKHFSGVYLDEYEDNTFRDTLQWYMQAEKLDSIVIELQNIQDKLALARMEKDDGLLKHSLIEACKLYSKICCHDNAYECILEAHEIPSQDNNLNEECLFLLALELYHRVDEYLIGQEKDSIYCEKALCLLGEIENSDTGPIRSLRRAILTKVAEELWGDAFFMSQDKQYVEAIPICRKVLDIYEEAYGKESWSYVMGLGTLRDCYGGLGNYKEAISLSEEVYLTTRRILDNEGRDYYNANYAHALRDLCRLYSASQNYEKALKLKEEEYSLEKTLEEGKGNSMWPIPVVLMEMAELHYKIGNDLIADSITLEAINRFSESQDSYQLSICYELLRNYDEAIRLMEGKIQQIRRYYYGDEEKINTSYALYAERLAWLYYIKGDYDLALKLGKHAMQDWIQYYGEGNIKTVDASEELALYSYPTKDTLQLNRCVTYCTDCYEDYIMTSFSSLTRYERECFWEMYKEWFEEKIHFYAYNLTNDTLVYNAYNGTLISKGLLLNSDVEFRKLIEESDDGEALDMYKDLRRLRLQINKLRETPKTERYTDVDSLERIAQEKEVALVELSKVYGDYTDNLVITWEQVQKKLTDGDMAVEFVSFPLNADSTMYIAYALKKGWEFPKMIKLFEEKQLKEVHLVDLYTTTDISELVWQPLEEVLEGIETVYFAPSGELYNIAIESVPDYATNGETIVSDSRTYYRLSSTRELALKKDKEVWKEAAVYGGLKYGMTAEGLTADSRSFKPTGEVSLVYTGELYNIADTLSVMRGGELAKSLPGTRIEAEAINKSLDASGVISTLYTDSIGTEASFKDLNGKKTSIMHIGTHGFYWTEKEARNLDYKFLMNNDTTTSRYVEDKQLTRSGLLFAGANYVLSGNENKLPEGVDDGILTAKELTTIDLRGLDLVVLSACQTGLGEITGDGVFGLQRGFKKAGAQTIVMSLWKVNDEATRLFMTKFFEEIRLDKEGHPTNKHEAFLAAQRYLRDEYEIEQTRTINSNLTATQRRRLEREGKSVEVQTITEKVKPYAAPEYWAAFIMLDGID